MKYSQKATWITLCALLSLTLSQCVLTNTDSGFTALDSTADVNPSPTAIVGMWHRHDQRAVPGGSTMSFLFRSDGTLVTKGTKKILGQGIPAPFESYRYVYAGRGVWVVLNDRAKFRLSQGRLLFYYPLPEYYDVLQFVFEREG